MAGLLKIMDWVTIIGTLFFLVPTLVWSKKHDVYISPYFDLIPQSTCTQVFD